MRWKNPFKDESVPRNKKSTGLASLRADGVASFIQMAWWCIGGTGIAVETLGALILWGRKTCLGGRHSFCRQSHVWQHGTAADALGRHNGQGEKEEDSKRPYITETLTNEEFHRFFRRQTKNDSRGHLNIQSGPQPWPTLKKFVRIVFSVMIVNKSCS